MAHKKAGGSSSNGRDSQSKRLGIKHYAGEFVTAGSILVRQRGTKVHPGTNVMKGGDDTLFCTIDGLVKFEYARGGRRRVAVYPEQTADA